MREVWLGWLLCSDLELGLGANGWRIGNYRSIIAAFLDVAVTTQLGTSAHERIMAEIPRGHQQPYIDQALPKRLQALVFTLPPQLT
jgi:hypothetical protein